METKEIVQKTDEWLNIRKGKFTGSEIWKLMTDSRSKTEQFSETAKTYILEKIAEQNANELYAKQLNTPAIQWGNEYEPLARKWYSKLTNKKVSEIGYVDLEPFKDHAGGSPDGLIEYQGLIEIKCPFNSANHIKHILVNAQDFKSELKEYYWQMQFYLSAMHLEWCDFISFDPRIDADWGMHIKRINRNDEDIKLMMNKIEQAIEYKNRITSQL